MTHRFVSSAVWQLPIARSGSGIVKAVFGGWEVAPIVTVQTGLALTVTQSEPFSIGGERRAAGPDRVGSAARGGSAAQIAIWTRRRSCQSRRIQHVPGLRLSGSRARNAVLGILRGPGLVDVDVNVTKMFPITERQRLQFRSEFFDLLNHTNLGVPRVNLGAGFGQIVSTSTEARVIQFALKYLF